MATTALAGCLGGDDGSEAQALKIGALMPQTGDLGPFGPAGVKAVELAVSEANDAGGVNGNDVVVKDGDTESKENPGVNEAQRLVNVESVHTIIGAYGSGVSKAVLQNIKSFGTPMVSPASTSPALQELDDNDVFFRTVGSDALQGKVMANRLEEQNVTRISILAINNPYGTGLGDVVEQEFDGIVQSYVKYDPQATTFDSTVDQATTPEPEVVVLIGYPDTGSQIMKTAYEDGKAGPNASIDWIFSEGLRDSSFPDLVNKTEEGEYIVAGYEGTTPSPQKPDDWINQYQNEYGDEPALFADGAYDSAAILMLASEKCDCRAGDSFKDAMRDVTNPPGTNVSSVSTGLDLVSDGEDVNYVGWTDTDWDEVGDKTSDVYAIWKVNEDGEIEIVRDDIEV